ncbi:DNA polymerase zeta catalytic subunit [Vitis vinifera]|uniref:DNA polymerase zeta catalytic subunit n=1 Tax=Vitis vinifera TaxID=29760 RepID=A0A438KBX8_VITVI|nr:DNA polymerase zeta catalytic subunit [Vitis vinifera]
MEMIDSWDTNPWDLYQEIQGNLVSLISASFILCPVQTDTLLALSFCSIDYNLYGMGHLHLSKMKFRHPVPDVFSSRKVNYNGQQKPEPDDFACISAHLQADSSGDTCLSSPVWISSTIPGGWMWQFSSQLDASPGQGICSPKRQSTCELEGDAIVEEILNQQFKLYLSLSQTHSDVKMVRSLIPIWEEEFERTGRHEVAMPPDPGKPLPEDVLRSLSHGLEFENKLGELCNQAGDSLAFTPLEKDERFMQSITSSADERNLVGDVLVSPNDNDGEPSKCFKDQNKNISPVSQGSLCEEDDDAIPSEGRGMCLQQLSVDERQRSENIGPSGLKHSTALSTAWSSECPDALFSSFKSLQKVMDSLPAQVGGQSTAPVSLAMVTCYEINAAMAT